MQHEKLGHNDDMKQLRRFLNVRMAGPSDEDGGDTGTGTITRTRTKTKKPSMYKVLLLNDDYTPMEFVVGVLTSYFNKTIDEASALTTEIHENGKGVAGIYPLEIAETKLRQTIKLARKEEYPLSIKLESE